MMSITKEFRFDAAHFLPTAPKGHPNSRMHGHSFAVALTLEAEPDPVKGWIRDFAEVERAIGELRGRLDHHLLNEIEGLELPTLERLARFIFDELRQVLPEIAAVTVRRDSLGEACTYRRA
jgi:6-pyruvoyltetrahydropterin/6-carboxytetrahydropterin synthase